MGRSFNRFFAKTIPIGGSTICLPNRFRYRSRQLIALLLSVCLSIACSSKVEQPGPISINESTRPVDHAMGVSNVPEIPTRVVVLDTDSLDAAIALGTTPIGARIHQTLSNYLGDVRTSGIVSVSSANQPNLEKIARLQPDLILGSKVGVEEIYPKLSRIAPTVLSESNGREGNWSDQLRLYAKAMGKEDRVDPLLDSYQQQLETVRQQIGTPEDTVVSVVFSEKSYIGFYSHTSFAGSILTDIGFSRPKIQTQPVSATYLSVVSKEAFQDLDGDIIFLLTSDSRDTLSLEEFIKDPLYSQLSAVKANEVYAVDSGIWTGGRNILAAQHVLSDISRALTLDEN